MPNKWNEFKTLLYSPNINKRHLFIALKSDYTFQDQSSVLKRVPKSFNTLMHGSILPKNYDQIGFSDPRPYNELELELNWLVNEVLKHKELINIYIEKKNSFEKSILIGDYDNSNRIYSEIENEISKSYWGIEMNFIQIKNEKGLEENIKFYNHVREFQPKDAAYYLFGSFFYYKTEDDVTLGSYLKELNSVRNQLSDENEYKEYLQYRLSFFNYGFTDFDKVVWVAKNQPLIDKYLLLRDYAAFLFSGNDLTKVSQQFVNQVVLLNNALDDSVFKKIISLLDDSSPMFFQKDNAQVVFDLYTNGEYKLAIKELSEILVANPTNFSLSLIYIKSLHQLNYAYSIPEKIKGSLLDTILGYIYKCLAKNEDASEAFNELKTISNILQSFDFAKQLECFLRNFNVNSNNRPFCGWSYFYNKDNNIFDYKIFKSVIKQKEFLSKYQGSITADFFLAILDGLKNLNGLQSIPNQRIAHYKSLCLLEENNYIEAIPILKKVLAYSKNINFNYERNLINLFICYSYLENYDDAIDLYISNYLENPNLVKQIDIERVALRISKIDKFRKIDTSDINISVFVALANVDTSNIYVAYNLFLKSLGVKKPSEMDRYLETIQHEKLIVFLKLVCSTKVLSRSVLVFKTSIEVLNERLLINQMLIKLDIDNQDLYSREITQLTRDLNVQKRKKEIDQSKIYIDEFGLINSELKQLKKGFDRYRNITEILKLSSYEGVGIEVSSLLKLMLGEIDSKAYQKSIKKTDYQFTVFRQLYLEIRDKFLFSDKFGLDYYLSTRIRHGTIEGQLRRSFNNTRIITNRNKEKDIYVDDVLWTKKLELDESLNEKFQYRIKEFSKNIDKIILKLKNEFIQIKTEDINLETSGWFEFGHYYDSNLYSALYLNRCQYITDFNELVKEVLEYLWRMTEHNLKLIRSAIDKHIRRLILNEIDEFEKDIREMLTDIDCKDFFSQITNCRTSVQKDIDKVQVWFKRSKSFDIDFKLEDVVATSLNTINNIDPNNRLILKENITFTGLLKGKYFTHFDDLLKIFFNNIVDYYTKPEEKQEINSEIIIKRTNDFISIVIKNELKSDDNEIEYKELIEGKIQKANDMKGLRGEGDSGLIKASNIISNVFRDTTNTMDGTVVNKQIVFTCKIAIKDLTV